MSHVAVERNRRRVMNEHLKVLRSLIPHFYIKRGDQASIIGGAIDFIKELQQVVKSLEAKRQRKSSISPPGCLVSIQLQEFRPFGTTNRCSNYKLGGCSSSNSPVANVEVKILGPNVIVVRMVSKKIPGQIVRIISVLENLCYQILEMNVSTMDDDTVLYSFVAKIGLEFQMSVEGLAFEVQRIFCLCQEIC